MAKNRLEDFVPVVRLYGLNSDKAVTLTSTLSVTGNVSSLAGLVARSSTTVPASAGAVAAGAPLTLFSAGPSIYVTSDAPAFTAVKGSICVNTGGSSTSTRLYINTTGSTTWTAITTVA